VPAVRNITDHGYVSAGLNVRHSPIVHHTKSSIFPAQCGFSFERVRSQKIPPLPVELRLIRECNDIGNPQLQQFLTAVTQEFTRSPVRIDVLGIVVRNEDGIQELFENCSPVGQKDLPFAGAYIDSE
jgi:hypothetical protein